MLIPFLAATAIAATFAQVGAMSVQISILTAALEVMAVALLIAVALELSEDGVTQPPKQAFHNNPPPFNGLS